MNIIVAGDIHLDAQTDGKSKDGIPVRVLDTYKSLEQIADYSIENNVNQTLLTGDYYAHSRPSQQYKTMFHKFIKRLTRNGIEVVILEGNHDMSRNSNSKSTVSEFGTLEVDGVYLADKPELLNFSDFQVATLPWQYHQELPEFDLDKTKISICIGHCTVWGEDQEAQWESELGKDFQVPIDYFYQFDYTILGHIHKHLVLNESPLIMYPGAAERHTWGERGDYGFVHITDSGWQHIPYNLRPKYDLFNEMPKVIDPEAMYRLTITDSFGYMPHELRWIFKDAFWFQLKELRRNTKDREIRIQEPIQDLPKIEQLALYFKNIDEEFTEEIKTLWTELTE